MELTTEERVYGFLKSAVDAATATNDAALPLFDLQVLDHPYRLITKDAGIIVDSDVEGDLSPFDLAEAMGEFNVVMAVVCFARVPSTQKDGDERREAMRQANDIAKAVALLFWNNPSCDERFRDTRCTRFVRGFTTLKKADTYAQCALTLLVNEVGGQISR